MLSTYLSHVEYKAIAVIAVANYEINYVSLHVNVVQTEINDTAR